MSPRIRREYVDPAPRKGPLARFLEGMDAKTVAIIVAGFVGVGGVKVSGDRQVDRVEAKADTLRAEARATRGRLRLSVDSLRVRVVVLEQEQKESRRVVRALKREVTALRGSRPAAPERPTAPETGSPGSSEDDADDEVFGPPEPPAKPQGAVRKVLGKIGRLFGGG